MKIVDIPSEPKGVLIDLVRQEIARNEKLLAELENNPPEDQRTQDDDDAATSVREWLRKPLYPLLKELMKLKGFVIEDK